MSKKAEVEMPNNQKSEIAFSDKAERVTHRQDAKISFQKVIITQASYHGGLGSGDGLFHGHKCIRTSLGIRRIAVMLLKHGSLKLYRSKDQKGSQMAAELELAIETIMMRLEMDIMCRFVRGLGK